MASSKEEFSRIRCLSDAELLQGLGGLLGICRKTTAQVIAFLGEVDERRLHLLAGSGSLFAYCTGRLGMSEDEACRRIDVARLSRRFPVLLDRLAAGGVSLSVAALLRRHLTAENQVALLAAVSGKTVAQAREVLAAWFPQPDVPSLIRKLPVRAADAPAATRAQSLESVVETAAGQLDLPSALHDDSVARKLGEADAPLGLLHASGSQPAASSFPASPPAVRSADACADVPRPAAVVRTAPLAPTSTSRDIVQPLSPERYKIQFTADAELKRKLDLARDLSRHALPQGDLEAIVGRALDLLIEQLMKQRFAATSRRKPGTSRKEPLNAPTTRAEAARVPPRADGDGATRPAPPSEPTTACSPPSQKRHLSREVCRAVLERDGARCTWCSPDGVRCDCQAWLEYDHITPRALGGGDDVDNIRLLCRAHNRLAAELTFGQATMERIIERRRARPAGGEPPSPAQRG